MASRETSRTLGSGLGHSRLRGPELSDVAENRGKGLSEAVQSGADSDACSAVDSTALDGAAKRQRTDDLSTGQHQAAPAGDPIAPQETSSDGAMPPCQPHSCPGKLPGPQDTLVGRAQEIWTCQQMRLIQSRTRRGASSTRPSLIPRSMASSLSPTRSPTRCWSSHGRRFRASLQTPVG